MVMKRVLLRMPEELLSAIDKEAQFNYMTRSDLMRRAFIWYLRPAARARREAGETDEEEPVLEELYTDPRELLEILQHQKSRAGIKRMLRDMKRRQADRRSGKIF